MRVLLFVILCLGGCYAHYPQFDLREPIYLVPEASYWGDCARNGDCGYRHETLVAGAAMWFSHLPPENRPLVVITDKAPAKSKNKAIHIVEDSNISSPAEFRWFSKPITIALRSVFLGPIAQYLIGHELGHAFLGPGHVGWPSIMRFENPKLRPTAEDLKALCRKHPELRCGKR